MQVVRGMKYRDGAFDNSCDYVANSVCVFLFHVDCGCLVFGGGCSWGEGDVFVEAAYPNGRGNIVSICVRVNSEPTIRQLVGCGLKAERRNSAFCPFCFCVGWWFVDV